ncbi:MAG: hypothetical protein ABEI53_01940 [Candidatus Magasanikbacteria bacterium]
MRGFIERAREKLKEIRESDDATKKRYLIGGSTLIFLLVIGVWLVWFSNSIPRVVPPEKPEVAEKQKMKPEKTDKNVDGFFSKVKRGFQITLQGSKKSLEDFGKIWTKGLNSFREALKRKRVYKFKKQSTTTKK